MSNKVLTGLTQTYGAKPVIWEHTGPVSYQSGGESLLAILIGKMDLSFVTTPTPPWTYSGNYFVTVSYPGITNGVTASVTLRWYVTATGVEVTNGTNLSAETIRLQIVGS